MRHNSSCAWEKEKKVIDRAMLACRNSGFDIKDHFPDLRKMVEIGSATKRQVVDYKLSRYACYLIVHSTRIDFLFFYIQEKLYFCRSLEGGSGGNAADLLRK